MFQLFFLLKRDNNRAFMDYCSSYGKRKIFLHNSQCVATQTKHTKRDNIKTLDLNIFNKLSVLKRFILNFDFCYAIRHVGVYCMYIVHIRFSHTHTQTHTLKTHFFFFFGLDFLKVNKKDDKNTHKSDKKE